MIKDFMANKKSSDFAICLYLSALYFFGNGYLFYLFFIVTINVVQYRFGVQT